MENEFVTSGKAAWIVIVLFTILAIIFGGCKDTVSDLNGFNCVLVVSGKTDKCIVVKKYHVDVYNSACGTHEVDYYIFPIGEYGYSAFKNYSQGDTIK